MYSFVTTETKVVKTLNKVIDGDGPSGLDMSIVPSLSGRLVEIVIGARYRDARCCHASKQTIEELINLLKDIHDAMED